NAPESYVVVKGDTLWDISGRFLEKPWRWPEIWRLNKTQIKNPHRIYPGDVIVLDLSDGSPRLRLGKSFVKLSPEVHIEPIPREVPSIPVHIIEPFISRPLVVTENELQNAPRIIDSGAQESRVVVGNGDEIYVLGAEEDVPRWHIYRPGVPLKDPISNKVLGYESIYLGTAKVKQPGEVAIMEVQTVKEEILKGDLLTPAAEPSLEPYVPHDPENEVSGNVVSIYGGVGVGGKDSIIAVSLGAKDGIEQGHVLGLYTRRSTVYQGKTIALPEQRYGVVFVFRVFENISYALVMETTQPMRTGDAIKNP
ncbi:MAG: LysM peptidoglycan-binding domain-containing protein, partial [Zoogloeaceae bacterium]|nr:LysM peptidoglycan-binding domain-containing protein [Zoogloeaceae bacterium]